MTRMFGPKGMKELSVTTVKGEKVLKAGKDGMFHVNNPKLIKELKAQGLGIASAGSGTVVRQSEKCCNSYTVKETCKVCVDKITTCGKCKGVLSPCRCGDGD
mgnify:FL=1